MNSFAFWEEMTDIDDALLQNAETVPHKKRTATKRLVALGIAAAMVVMLAASAFAVGLGVNILRNGNTEAYEEYLSNAWLSIHYSSVVMRIDYALQEQAPSVPEEWIEALTKAWTDFPYDCRHFTGTELLEETGARKRFDGIEELEDLLNIGLVNSPALDEQIRGGYVTLVISDPQEAQREFETSGRVTPDGIILYFPLEKADGVEYCGMSVYLALKESFLEEYSSHEVLSGIPNQNFTQRSLHTQGGIEVAVLQNEPQEGYQASGYLAWCENGIGYLIEIKCLRSAPHAPADLITPYLEDLTSD